MSHRVEYGFTVEEEGYYRIKAGVLAPNDNDDSFYVRIDTEPSAGYLWDLMQNTTYASDFVSDRGGEDPVEVCLTGGPHTVGVYLREDGTRLDTIGLEFVRSGSCEPLIVEAEDMDLDGYAVESNSDASGGKLIKTENENSFSQASLEFTAEGGKYDILIAYFDENDGESSFEIDVDGKNVAKWRADGNFAEARPSSNTLTRRIIYNVAIKSGDRIVVNAKGDSGEWARVDRITFRPHIYDEYWDNTESGGYGDILKEIDIPNIPDKDCDDVFPRGENDSRSAIQNAIDSCSAAGGGRVVVTSGIDFVDGPIHLKSKVELHLEKDPEIRFSEEAGDYYPSVETRWEGTVCMNYSPLIYANNKNNVAITGEGIINGRDNDDPYKRSIWWSWIGDDKQGESSEKLRSFNVDPSIPPEDEDKVFGNIDCGEKGCISGDKTRCCLRPAMIEFYECTNILVEGVTIKNSPFWCVHPVFSENITIRNLSFAWDKPSDLKEGEKWPPINTDGIDVDSCKNVLIEKIDFFNGDDNIAIKSGRDAEGRAYDIPSEKIIIRDCNFSNYSALAIGSEMSGDVRNVFAEHLKPGFADPAERFPVLNGIYLKSNADRGGRIEHIRVRDVHFVHKDDNKVAYPRAVINMTTEYPGSKKGVRFPEFQDLIIEDLMARTTQRLDYAIYVNGKTITGVDLKNIDIKGEFVTSYYLNDGDVDITNVNITNRGDNIYP